MLTEILDYGAIVAIITFLFGLVSARIIYRWSKKDKSEEEADNHYKDRLTALKKVEREVTHCVDTLKEALIVTYRDFVQSGDSGPLLWPTSYLYFPSLKADYRYYYDKFDHHDSIAIGLDRMLNEFYSGLSEYNDDKLRSDDMLHIDAAFPDIYKLEDIASLGNELIYQLQWVIKEIAEPGKIQESIRHGAAQFTGNYEGTWAVPWLEKLERKDERYKKFKELFFVARKTYNETGTFMQRPQD